MSKYLELHSRQLIDVAKPVGYVLPPEIDSKLQSNVIGLLQSFSNLGNTVADVVANKYIETYFDGFGDGIASVSQTP